MGLPKCTVVFILVCFRPPKTDRSTSTLTSSQVQSSGLSLLFTADQSVCTIATDGNQSTPSVSIYSSQRLPFGHTSTLDNSSGLNSFQLHASDFLGNQTFRPNVTSASRIQTDKGSTTPIDFNQFMFSMKVMFVKAFSPQLMLLIRGSIQLLRLTIMVMAKDPWLLQIVPIHQPKN